MLKIIIKMAKILNIVICLSSLFIPSWSEECGDFLLVNKIAYGMRASLGEFPWMVVLIYGEYRNATGCAGSLITKKHVLTAAHCLTGEKVRKVGNLTAVRVGEYDLSTEIDCVKIQREVTCASPSEDILVESVHSHPNYSSEARGHNDIGLVKLADEVTYGDYVRPLCLPNEIVLRKIAGPRVEFTVAGWGATENGEKDYIQVVLLAPSDVLLKTKIPLFSKNSCSSNNICAGGSSNDTCRGDSGGPLMFLAKSPIEKALRWYVVGVTAYGPKECGRDGSPAIYTNTSEYLEWINAVIKI